MIGPLGACLLYVEDFDRMCAFYRDTVGFAVSHEGPGALAFDVGGCILELMSRSNDPSPRDPGNSALVLSFRVDDLQVEIDRLRAAGVEMVGDVRETVGTTPAFGIARFADPEGNWFELIDMPLDWSPPEA